MQTAYQLGWSSRVALAGRFVIGYNPYGRGDADYARWRSGWADACQYLAARRACLRRAEA